MKIIPSVLNIIHGRAAGSDGSTGDNSSLEAKAMRRMSTATHDDENEEEFEASLSSAESAVDRIKLIVERYGTDSVTVMTSFGVQSGVMLGLVSEACPVMRVMYIHTQSETSERDLEYGRRVLDVLRLGENLTVAKAEVTREEFRRGMEDVGITAGESNKGSYRALSQNVFKIAPLKGKCAELNIKCLLSGVRRGQTSLRNSLNFLELNGSGPDPDKGHPILDWNDERCLAYLKAKNIPQHPEMDGLRRSIKEASIEVKIASDNEEKKVEDANGNKTPQVASPTTEKRPSVRFITGPQRLKSGRRLDGLLRSQRASQANGMECGLHVKSSSSVAAANGNPEPPLPNVVVGKIKCRFCIAAKKLLKEQGTDYVEAPVHLFPHLVPVGFKTVPVVYLDGLLVGGYGDLCKHFGVADTMNSK